MWIKHPRSKKPDTMLTLAVVATLTALGKFALNDVVIGSVNFGTMDATLLAAMLTPTLGAYVARKFKDSPDAEG